MLSTRIWTELQNIPVVGPRWLKMVKIDTWRLFLGRIPEMEASSFALDERGEVNLTSDTCQISDASNSEVQMPDHRQVPGIAHGPQRFSRANAQPVQSPMMAGQVPPPQSAEEAIAESMADMAMEIYCRVVSSHICADRVDPEVFQTLAKHSQAAAKAYFESMGVQFDG